MEHKKKGVDTYLRRCRVPVGIIGIDAVAIIIWPRAKNPPPASAKGTRWRGDFFDRAEFMLIEPPRECIFMIRTWRVLVIEYCCDKVRFQYKYVLSTLLVIIRVDSITNYVLSTYL